MRYNYSNSKCLEKREEKKKEKKKKKNRESTRLNYKTIAQSRSLSRSWRYLGVYPLVNERSRSNRDIFRLPRILISPLNWSRPLTLNYSTIPLNPPPLWPSIQPLLPPLPSFTLPRVEKRRRASPLMDANSTTVSRCRFLITGPHERRLPISVPS